MNLEDVVISVAQKEGWAVTIERKAETDIFFEFENLRQKERILFSLSTPVTIASGCLLIISLNIIRTTTQIMKHIYGLGLTGTEKMARHTILRILWRTWKLPRKWCINFTMFSAMSATNKQRKTPAKSLNTWQVLKPIKTNYYDTSSKYRL